MDAPYFNTAWRGWDFRVYIGVHYLFGNPYVTGCYSIYVMKNKTTKNIKDEGTMPFIFTPFGSDAIQET